MPWSMPLPPMQPTQEDIDMCRKTERMMNPLEKKIERQRLRDQFAAAALTGLLYPDVDDEFAMSYNVRRAYMWADAMLAERERERE